MIAEGVESEDVARELIKLDVFRLRGICTRNPCRSPPGKKWKISKRVVYVCPESISSYYSQSADFYHDFSSCLRDLHSMVKERVYGLKQSVIDTAFAGQILLNIGVAWQLISSTR